MTIAEIIAANIKTSPVQILAECLRNARSVKAKKGTPAHTRVEFVTQNLTPNDLLYFDREFRCDERKPRYYGLIVWVR